ncbi:hypothetical protein ACI65C_007381 [Semiaphis heraclei]
MLMSYYIAAARELFPFNIVPGAAAAKALRSTEATVSVAYVCARKRMRRPPLEATKINRSRTLLPACRAHKLYAAVLLARSMLQSYWFSILGMIEAYDNLDFEKSLILIDKYKEYIKVITREKSIKLEQIQTVENKKVYIIKSSSNPSQQHYIIKTDETCTHSSCLKCKKCNICIHTFHCSCIDNVIKANICKHIHACAREFISLDGNTDNTVFHNSNMKEQKTLMDMVATSNHHKGHKNQTIISQTEIILSLSSTNEYSNENLQKIEKKLAEVIAIMNEGGQTHLKTVEEVNVQRKIDPQLRLYSTKKKPSKTSIAKPSVNEVNAIISGLKDDNNETINVHNTFDHSYS